MLTEYKWLKIYFSYFPKWIWIALVGGIVSQLLFPAVKELSYLAINFACLFLFVKIATIIHEAGHLCAAYFVGGIPKRMTLGIGHEVYRSEWRGVKIILNSVPIGGTAGASFGELSFFKWRYSFYLMGGVLFNVTAAGIFYLVFGFNSSFYSGIHAASAFILVNAAGVLNLIPFYSNHYGFRMPTDGLGVLQTLFGFNKTSFKYLLFSEEYYQAFEYFENREYEKSFALYDAIHKKIPNEVYAISMMSVILLKQCKADESLLLLTSLEERVESKELKKIKGVIYNNIAWAYFLKNDLLMAYQYSTQAIKWMSRNRAVSGTYGCILIERGDIEIGMQWVSPNVDHKHPNDITLVASIYMALAFHMKKEFNSRDNQLNFVSENESTLDLDSLLLLKRCRNKMEKENS